MSFNISDADRQPSSPKFNISAEDKQDSKGNVILDGAASTAGYVGGKVVDLGTGTAADLIKNLPGIIGDLAEGNIGGATFKIVSPIAGNVASTAVEIGFDGVGYTLKSGGKVLYKATTSDEFISGVQSVTTAGLDQLSGVAQEASKIQISDITDKDLDVLQKIIDAPADAALGFADEMSLGLLRLVLENGMGVEAFKEAESRNPDAYNAGSNAGFVVGLAGVPLAAGKFIGKGAVNIVRKLGEGAVQRKNLKLVKGMRDDLVEEIGKLGRTEELFLLNKATISRKTAYVNSIEGLLKGFKRRSVRTDPSKKPLSNKELAEYWEDAVSELPAHNPLKEIPSLNDWWFNRVTKENLGEASTGWIADRFVDGIKANWKVMANNWRPEVVELVGDLAGDAGVNFYVAYQSALEQGKPHDEATALALGFALTKTPVDVGVDAVSKVLGSDYILALLGRIGLTLTRTEDGQVIFEGASTAPRQDHLDYPQSFPSARERYERKTATHQRRGGLITDPQNKYNNVILKGGY